MYKQRRDHIVPRFLLKEFAGSATSKGVIYGFDIDRGRCRKGHPASIGYLPDYYRIDVPGVPPELVDDIIGRIESQAAVALRQIRERPEDLGSEDVRQAVMIFIALMLLRTPTYFDWIRKYHADRSMDILKQAVSSPDAWRSAMSEMQGTGHAVRDNVGYERMRAFVHSDRRPIHVPQVTMIHNIVEFIEPTSVWLGARSWLLIRVREGQGNLICSDHPVGLAWTMPDHPDHPPGLLLEGTEVTIPIHRRAFLHGAFSDLPSVDSIDRRGVAAINARTIASSKRFIYAPDDDFTWMKPDGGIGDWADFLEVRP